MNHSNRSILIIEDSPEDFYTAKRGLRAAGLANNFIHCETGEQALDYFFGRDDPATWVCPQLVLLDLNLPGMDGADVLERLKSSEKFKQIPVVVLTTSDDPDDIETSYALGANSYIRKPVDLEGFISALKRLNNYWFEVVLLPQPAV